MRVQADLDTLFNKLFNEEKNNNFYYKLNDIIIGL